MDAIERRARELLAKIAGLPLRASDDEVIALIVAALTPPEGYVLVPAELPDMSGAPGFAEGNYSRSNWHAAIADFQWLVARPEVP